MAAAGQIGVRGAPALDRVQDAFHLTGSELGALFGVTRQAVEQWRIRGVPVERSADVDRVAEAAAIFTETFIPARVPQIVRTPGRGLRGRTVLEVLAADGAVPVLEYLYGLLNFGSA